MLHPVIALREHARVRLGVPADVPLTEASEMDFLSAGLDPIDKGA